MLRLARSRRLSGLCCVLAGLVAATPALPCILLCANHAHLQHMPGSQGPMHHDGPGHGSAPSAPASLPCTGRHVPAPLTSVVRALTAAAMYPSTSTVALAEPMAQRTGQHHAPALRTTPGLPPVPPPPRSA